MEFVNSNQSFVALRSGGHDISFELKDTRCEHDYGLGVLVDLWTERTSHIDAFIGESF